jgi:hypothetical protein
MLWGLRPAVGAAAAAAAAWCLPTAATACQLLVDRLLYLPAAEKHEPPAAAHRSMVMRDANGTLSRCYIPELASAGGTVDASGEGGSSVGTVNRISTAG